MSARGASLIVFAVAAFYAADVARRQLPGLRQAAINPTHHHGVPQIDLEVGAQLCLPSQGLSTGPTPRTIVIATLTGCSACEVNQPFEQRLFAECTKLGIPVVYLLGDRKRENARVAELKTIGRTVVQADLLSIGITRTPTIAALDQTGRIVAMTVGAVGSDESDSLLIELTRGVQTRFYSQMSRKQAIAAIDKGSAYQLVAFANPTTPIFSGARYKVMPLGELFVRAGYELSRDHLTYVDCSSGNTTPRACQEGLLILSKARVRHLVGIEVPVRSSSENCSK